VEKRSTRASANDAQKIGWFEGRPTNEATVNVGLGEQFGRVGGVHAAAVEDVHAIGVFRGGFELRAQDGVHGLGLLGRGGFAGADGPDGLVGHDDLADAVAIQMDHGGELTLDDFFGATGVSLGEGFAHAHDGGDACGERALGLVATVSSVSPWYWRRSEWPTMA